MLAEKPRLFAALEAAFPVSFRATNASTHSVDGAIVFCDGDAPRGDELARPGVPVFAFGGGAESRDDIETVELSDHEFVDRRVRGIDFPDRVAGPPLSIGDAEHAIATTTSGPTWAVNRGPAPVHRVRSTLPELEPDQVLSDLLVERAFPVVALVHFLRSLTEGRAFDAPPLRAVFLFDDPNLRWRTYGFIDYSRLLEHADQHDYHASMAMIPLDGGRPHRSTAALFRRRPDRLSLVFHGNNHLNEELMRPTDDAGALALAAQALRRVERFESRYGMRVDRIMVPPHGLCSESTTRALGSLGFDALCAAHPLPWTHRPPADRPLAGWEPAEFAGGCAVIPRVPFTAPRRDMALRAFLGQPLVLYGHHDDLADGIDLLAETASWINGLGDVRWMSLGGIAATNYSARSDGDALRLRPYSRRMEVTLPDVPGPLVVEAPRDGEPELLGWSSNGDAPTPFYVPADLTSGDAEVRLRGDTELDPQLIPAPSWRPWPLIRRAATELRDRMHAFQRVSYGLVVSTQMPEWIGMLP